MVDIGSITPQSLYGALRNNYARSRRGFAGYGKTTASVVHHQPLLHRGWEDDLDVSGKRPCQGDDWLGILCGGQSHIRIGQTRDRSNAIAIHWLPVGTSRIWIGGVAVGEVQPETVTGSILQDCPLRITANGRGKIRIEREGSASTKPTKWTGQHVAKSIEVLTIGIDTPGCRRLHCDAWEAHIKRGFSGLSDAGLRRGDMLRLTMSDLKEDGIHVTPEKTKDSSGKSLIYEWNPDLKAAVDAAKAARPRISNFLFCNRLGEGYLDEETGRAGGWDSMWRNFVDRVMEETDIKDRFTEHDLRAKCASDAETLEHAQQLLAHADSRTTKRVYRRKAERVKPLNSKFE